MEKKQEYGPKRQKFRQLAEGRTNRAIKAILRIGNLSNRQYYEWEDTELRKITRALRRAVTEVENKFKAPGGKSDAIFKL